MMNGCNVYVALLCAFIAVMLAGLVTGVFHTVMGIPAILAGILTQLALYSINLRILGLSLIHIYTEWNCKYHIVFAPKYRRKVFFGEKREAIGKILRQLCEWKGVEIHEA